MLDHYLIARVISGKENFGGFEIFGESNYMNILGRN